MPKYFANKNFLTIGFYYIIFTGKPFLVDRLIMQGTNENLHCEKKRSRSNSLDPPAKKQKKNSSLLELCEREEWNIIIGSVHDLIQVWDFDERNAEENTPIHICCTKGSLNVLQHLLQTKKFNFKESKGKNGNSCVLLAAQNGQLETVKWLIENGCSTIDETNNENNSCLLLAAQNGHLETVKWLIENGCSTNEKNDLGDSCLILAAQNGHLETVKWLIEYGCSIHEKNTKGYSCLLCAARKGHLETVKLLIDHGCSINETTNENDSCLLLAAGQGHLETVKWLVENGCSTNEKKKKKVIHVCYLLHGKDI